MAPSTDDPMVVHGRCHEPSYGRRFVHGLFYDTVDGPVVRAMEHVMVMGSTLAPSMLHVGCLYGCSYGTRPRNIPWAPMARATEWQVCVGGPWCRPFVHGRRHSFILGRFSGYTPWATPSYDCPKVCSIPHAMAK